MTAEAPSIRVDAGYAVIRIPLSEVHGLRVALAECPCRAPKSIATAIIRQRLAAGLGKISTGPQAVAK